MDFERKVFGSTGLDKIYTSMVDSQTGSVYSIGFTENSVNISENGNFIIATDSNGVEILDLHYSGSPQAIGIFIVCYKS